MTRKDYILVAREFASQLAAANPNFQREKFLAACLKDPN